jgi:hypothetical protein
MENVKERHATIKYLWLIVFFLVLSFPAHAQSPQQPFNLDQLIGLLKNKVAESEIKKQIEQYKVDFELTSENMRALIVAGASDQLLKVIEKNAYQELTITAPKNDEEVGSAIRVEGKSKKFSGKHLWVFAQRKGLSVWWPQGGEVKPEQNGEWMQGVFLGESQDVGFNFEIVAKWVSESIHKDMITYLQTGDTTGRYPGIRLPDGSPEARITVKKTSP